jgi:hypothetical protein
VELLLLIGYFRMICGLMTTLEVEVESPFGAIKPSSWTDQPVMLFGITSVKSRRAASCTSVDQQQRELRKSRTP